MIVSSIKMGETVSLKSLSCWETPFTLGGTTIKPVIIARIFTIFASIALVEKDKGVVPRPCTRKDGQLQWYRG